MDFKALGFKCGLEIHQRLDTRKLFCDCYANPSQQKPSEQKVELDRRLRASPGELGAVDAAAVFEASKKRVFKYYAPLKETCLVECDDEPPRELNKEALRQAIAVAKALNMRFVDEVQVMRKTVVDGSAVSGFQRTALVAVDGSLEASKGVVGIQTLCLEEESAGILGKNAFALDRLGVPLIEIATDASIKDPRHCKEVAEKLGLLLRTAASVQRGIGSIRQDVNVSIAKGARVEIKGVQDLKLLPKIVENEADRQLGLANQGKKVEEETRKAVGDETEYMRPLPGKARMYPETDVPPYRITKELVESVGVAKSFDDRLEEFQARGLKPELAKRMAQSSQAKAFEEIVEETRAGGTVVAATLLETLVSLRRDGVNVNLISVQRLKELFKAFAAGRVTKAALPEALKAMAEAPDESAAKLLKQKGLERLSLAQVKSLAKKEGRDFGELMRKHRLVVDARDLKKALKA